MRWESLVLGALATWRVTNLLVAEEGPGRIFVRLRALMRGTPLAGLLDCFYCASLWVSAPIAGFAFDDARGRGLGWLALSTLAILLHHHLEPPAPTWREDPEPDHELLRP